MAFWQAHLNVPCIPEIKAVRPHARDNIMLCDAASFADKIEAYGARPGHDYMALQFAPFIAKLRTGDPSLVYLSDKYIRDLEEQGFLSKAWHARQDCIGSLPIVPAFIAGQPMNMRRRERTRKPQGPLSIFLESTGSASTMSERETIQRGAAMLALVRILSEQRPVDLWICTTFGTHNEMNGLLCRIETQPMDIGRAAHMLTQIGMVASAGHSIIQDAIGHSPGSWSYGTPELERTYCGDIFCRFLHPGSDIVYVPAALTGDSSLSNHGQWVRAMLLRYGGDSVERDDDPEESEIDARPIEGPNADAAARQAMLERIRAASQQPQQQPRRYRRRRRW